MGAQRHERASEASNAKCPLQRLVRHKYLVISWLLFGPFQWSGPLSGDLAVPIPRFWRAGMTLRGTVVPVGVGWPGGARCGTGEPFLGVVTSLAGMTGFGSEKCFVTHCGGTVEEEDWVPGAVGDAMRHLRYGVALWRRSLWPNDLAFSGTSAQAKRGARSVRCKCAGINRRGGRNERVRHRRRSESRWPRVMRWFSKGRHRSVDRGMGRQGKEPRDPVPGADGVCRYGRQHRAVR